MPPYKNFLGEEFYYSLVHTPTFKPNTFFLLDMCGLTPPNPKYDMFRNNNSVYVFEYVNSGSGYIDSEGKRYKVSAGDFYMLKRGFTGHYYADRIDPYEKIWVNARGELVDHATEMFGLTDDVTVFHCRDNKIKRLILAIHRVMSAKNCDVREAHRIASVKLIEILSILKNGEMVSDCTVANRASTAEFIREYLSDHIYSDVKLSDLASQLFMHEATVIRIFRDAYGVTPIKYLNALRIDAAKNMLYDLASVKDIAEMLRFSDAAYFSNCFKKETGMTPTQYKMMVLRH